MNGFAFGCSSGTDDVVREAKEGFRFIRTSYELWHFAESCGNMTQSSQNCTWGCANIIRKKSISGLWRLRILFCFRFACLMKKLDRSDVYVERDNLLDFGSVNFRCAFYLRDIL